MFKLLTVHDEVRVDPKYLDKDIEDAILSSVREEVEGKLEQDIGVILCVTQIKEYGEGEIVHGDASIHFPVTYEALVFTPENNEVVLGEVIEITEFGAFVRIGALDALVHVSQVMSDRVSYDRKNSLYFGRRTKRKLQEGDLVRARIVGVSLGKVRQKISLTMRQPYLGSLKWIEEEKRKAKEKKKK